MNESEPGIGDGLLRVSVVVPILNEEDNLRQAVKSIIEAAKEAGNVAIEIILVNDGSTDATARIVEELAKEHPFIRSVHHPTNAGFGAAFLSGLELARCERITLFPADNVVSIPTFRSMLKNAGKADVVLAYTVNTEARSALRRLLSAVYTLIYLTVFDIHLRYINATPVYPVSRLRELKLRCQRYTFPSEPTVKLLRKGCSYLEIQGFANAGSQKSSAIRIKSLLEVVVNFLLLAYEIYFRNSEEYSHAPVRVIPDELR